MRSSLLVLLIGFVVIGQPAASEAGPGAADASVAALDGAIPLYSGKPPNGPSNPNSEQWFGNRPSALAVRNVSIPTLRPVLPSPDKNTGAGVIVAPGGAFLVLAIGSEGMEVAKALADRGIAAFVLKYRTVPTPSDERAFEKDVADRRASDKLNPSGRLSGEEVALLDAQAAIRLVRARAADWNVDPHRLGMLGFSAGAISVRNVLLANAADARPDFAGLIYGQMIAHTPAPNAPPIFIAFAADDPLFGRQGFGLVESWRAADRPVELHYYETGGHGFGMTKQGKTSDVWFDQFIRWMDARGLMSRR